MSAAADQNRLAAARTAQGAQERAENGDTRADNMANQGDPGRAENGPAASVVAPGNTNGGPRGRNANEIVYAIWFTYDGLSELIQGDPLGSGQFGTVYPIRGYPKLVVKEVRTDSMDTETLDATRLELATVSKLPHSGIIKYHQVLENGHFIRIVMDRHDTSLDVFILSHMRRKEPIPLDTIYSIMRQAVDALSYAHNVQWKDAKGEIRIGFAHRDIKPANILMSADGERIVIADFGLCKDATRSGRTFVGTPAYMAPETFISKKTSTASDIWAIGVMLYELATLKRPNFLDGKKPEDVYVAGWKPDLSEVEDNFIRGILEKILVLDPKDRPTARDIVNLLGGSGHVPNDQAQQSVLLEAALSRRIEALERSVAARIDALFQEKSATITTQSIAIASHSRTIDDLEKELQAKDTEIASLKSTVASQSDEMGTLRSTIASQAEKIASQAKTVADLEKALQDKSNKIDTLQESVATLKAELTAKFAEVASLKPTVASQAKTVASLEKTVSALPSNPPPSEKDEEQTAQSPAPQPESAATVSPPPVSKPDDSWTPLMHAAASGDIEEARKHLSDKDKKNGNGDTALIIAARAGHEDIVELLDPTSENGETALMRAADRNDMEAVKALAPLQKGRKMDGSDWINRWTISKGTALMRAAAYGHTEVVRVLVEHEGGMKDEYGKTALMAAARTGHPECVKLLLDKEGGIQNKYGWTALMYAAENGHPECVKLLLDKEGGMQTNDGWTALMHAAATDQPECVKLLMDKEGGMQSNNGWTALMWAAYWNKPECAALLSSREKSIVTIHEWNGFPAGSTALDIAMRCNSDNWYRRIYGDYAEVISILSK